MANFQEPARHIFGSYLNIARANFYKTIFHIFSISGIDCYTQKGDLYFKEDNLDKVIKVFYLISKGESTKDEGKKVSLEEEIKASIDTVYEVIKKCYDNRWNNEVKQYTNLTEREKNARKEAFKAPLTDEGPNGEKARIRNTFTIKGEQEERFRKMLFRHIPLLAPIMANVVAMQFKKNVNEQKESNKAMHDASLTDCLKELYSIAQCLTDCRNFYTHMNPYNSIEKQKDQFKLQNIIASNLDKAFAASRRIAKKRNSYSESDLTFLTGHQDDCRMQEVFVLDENGKKKWKVEKNEKGETKLDKEKNPIYIYKKVKAKDDKGKEKRDEKGKPIYEVLYEDGKPVHEYETKLIEREDFYYRIRGIRQILNPNLTPNGEVCDGLSAFGMLYFCSLFLSKELTVQLCTETQIFVNSPYNNDNNKKNNIILNMMFVYAIHIPRGKRLDSECSSQALALDMLNELRRCPIELYNVLPATGKREFEDDIKHENDKTPEFAKRIRSKDRFPHLALSYIDSQGLFENIRFQVRLGSYRFCFYDKICIDGKKHPRQLHKEINGYGRLQDMEKARREQYGPLFQQSRDESVWQKDENTYVNLRQLVPIKAGDQPHITDTVAQYNIHQNRIGLFWNTDEENKLVNKTNAQGEIIYNGYYLPLLNSVDSPTENNKHKWKATIDMPAPLCSLSVFELPAMLFYNYLRSADNLEGDEFPTPENIIINQYDNLHKFFIEVKDIQPTDSEEELATILNGYGLSKQSIPKKIYDYLSNKKTTIGKDIRKTAEKEVKERLRKAILKKQHFEQNLDRIENTKDNKFGKDSFASIRYAKIAEELTKSMMEWQSENTKMTGLNFRVLTATFAKFGDGVINQDAIISMLEKAEIIGGDHPHCFIEKAVELEQFDIEELYIDYISAEINYLKGFLRIDEKEIEKEQLKNFLKIVGKTSKSLETLLLDALRKDNEAPEENKRILLIKDVDYNQLPFIHKSRKRWCQSGITELANRYLYVKEEGKNTLGRATLLLPDGMFYPYIVKAFQYCHQELIDSINNLSVKQKKGIGNNAAYLINLYFESKGKKSQPFYDSTEPSHLTDSIRQFAPHKYARSYEFFKIIKGWQIHLSCAKMREMLAEKETKINNKVNGLTEKGDYNSLEEAKNALRRKLHSTLCDMKDNERTIRRYKTQDRILFMMVKSMLGDIVNQNADLFKLENVCENDFLSQKIKAQISVKSNNQQITIQKDDMPIKDYGKLFRLLNDERTVQLLSYSILTNPPLIDFDQISEELKQYNTIRSSAFKSFQQMEQESFIQHERVLTDPENNDFYQGGRRYKNNEQTKENDAKRNNFSSLLKILQCLTPKVMNMFKENDRQLITAIRNAFDHNSYPNWEVCRQLLEQEQQVNANIQLELSQVAAFLISKIRNYVKQIEEVCHSSHQ